VGEKVHRHIAVAIDVANVINGRELLQVFLSISNENGVGKFKKKSK
jgi:hypothetical protein